MIWLCDNDVIQKLATCDLIEHALELECPPPACFILPTAKLKYHVAKPDAGRRKYGEETFRRISDFLLRCEVISEAPPLDLLSRLQVGSIDAGEAILYAVGSLRNDASIVVTGDKNSIRKLSCTPSCSDVACRLRRRILCFEHLVLRMIDFHGFDEIKRRCVCGMESDKVLQVAFGSGDLATEKSALEGLTYYYNELKQSAGELLCLA